MKTLLHNPGGKVSIPLPAGVSGSAKFSKCGRYRTELWRVWQDKSRYALFVGLNPSTADIERDDRTCAREWKLARSLGYTAYAKANTLSLRLTDSRQLVSCGIPPRSDDNLKAILRLAKDASLVVMACGALPKPLQHYAAQTINMLRADGHRLMCFGTTKDGWPRHPVRLANNVPLVKFETTF